MSHTKAKGHLRSSYVDSVGFRYLGSFEKLDPIVTKRGSKMQWGSFEHTDEVMGHVPTLWVIWGQVGRKMWNWYDFLNSWCQITTDYHGRSFNYPQHIQFNWIDTPGLHRGRCVCSKTRFCFAKPLAPPTKDSLRSYCASGGLLRLRRTILALCAHGLFLTDRVKPSLWQRLLFPWLYTATEPTGSITVYMAM